MDIAAIITMVTEFFSSIPWENVIGAFMGSVNGIDWGSLGKIFEIFDMSDGTVQTFIDSIVTLFQTLFGAAA